MKKLFKAKILTAFVLLTFISSAIYFLIKAISAPTVATYPDALVKRDYILMITPCVSGIFVMLLPFILMRIIRCIKIPSAMKIIYMVFMYCHIFLGEILLFYYRVPYWDTLLHILSQVALSALGFSVTILLNELDFVEFTLAPIFAALFSFCFAVSLGVIWEIYEFMMDLLFNTNMQKFALESGEQLIGQAALADTMKDLITDAMGAFIMAVVGYLLLRHKRKLPDFLQLKFNKT